MSRVRYVLAIVLAVPGICWSQDLSPGLWRISLQVQSAAVPVTMPPLQLSQCLSAEDAKDPAKLLGSVASPGATGCTYSDKRYSGNSFHFAMECTGTLAIRATGNVSFTSTSVSGTIATSATVTGQPVEMRNSISAQRIGDCIEGSPSAAGGRTPS